MAQDMSKKESGYDVFISHSSEDKAVAEGLYRYLKDRNIRCWMDSEDILPGQDYAREIAQAIKKVKVFVLVFSRFSAGSKHVEKEIILAEKRDDITVIPFRLEDFDYEGTAMEYHLADPQWIDAFPDPEPAFGRLAAALSAALGSPLSAPPEKKKTHGPEGAPEPGTAPEPPAAKPSAGPASRPRRKTSAAGSRRFLVIDLSGGPGTEQYPFRWTDDEPDLPNDLCRTGELWLRRIPAGSFTMGSPEDETGRGSGALWAGAGLAALGAGSALFFGPLGLLGALKLAELKRRTGETMHDVTLTREYCMGIFPVTQRQWELVMGSSPSKFRSAGPGTPVEQVSYDDICGADRPWPGKAGVAAGSFLGRLREKTGLAALDLPTEAQWEYACRAGTATALNNGNDIGSGLAEVGWYDENSGNSKHIVGEKSPNAWGLYDMHGNVWEWCRDWLDSYTGDGTDPLGPAKGSLRVCRGGSWGSCAGDCRSANRAGFGPNARRGDLGFRLVLDRVP